MTDVDVLSRRIAELEEEVTTWKELAADLHRQLANARKSKKASTPEKGTAPGFESFWSAWPSSHRKANKGKCLAKWVAAGLERMSEEIVSHVKACASSRDWLKDGGQFIPAPLVYLNQERYLAPAPARDLAVGSLSGISYSNDEIDSDGYFN